jgi:hypothetical protein
LLACVKKSFILASEKFVFVWEISDVRSYFLDLVLALENPAPYLVKILFLTPFSI